MGDCSTMAMKNAEKYNIKMYKNIGINKNINKKIQKKDPQID
jgi:hypothetical protein